MATLRQRIENNPVVYFLAVLVGGFLSGVGAYEATLRIAGRTTVAAERLEIVESKLKDKDEKIATLTRELEQANDEKKALAHALVKAEPVVQGKATQETKQTLTGKRIALVYTDSKTNIARSSKKTLEGLGADVVLSRAEEPARIPKNNGKRESWVTHSVPVIYYSDPSELETAYFVLEALSAKNFALDFSSTFNEPNNSAVVVMFQ